MALPIQQGTWSLDSAHSGVAFAIRHLGISTIRGRFGTVEATLTVGQDLASSSLTAEVDMSSVDTGNPDRDAHLRSTDIFDADSQPTMSFRSTAITEARGDHHYSVTGDLTIHGHTQEETLDVTFNGIETNPVDGSTRVGFEACGAINRADYGITWNVPLESGGGMLSESVDIVLDAQLVASS